ncbi:glycosyltransferase family 9 protein [Oryzomonas sagensis]|uniref:Glycosyltransferase family 9 protein n=1 Tax=Oryzomonas sagensis TaxID=2603857 RepID=A0ABQ6TUD6_9BACT|nr:glycosyltransferase family 9 protein [Oryzomonas sagensis]KAB0672327.1 glycosyltransferase family 9 protein [Oryzomonas sagensis]
MKIDWRRVKYVKGILPFLHKGAVPVIFALDYLRLWLRRRKVKKEAPERKFVVINLIEHFGDIVACEPVARDVKTRDPNAYLVWMVRRPYRELVLHNPAIDQVFVLSCLTEWIYLAGSGLFDEIIDLHPQNRKCPICHRPLLKERGNTEITIETYYNYGNLLAAYCQSAGIPVIEDQPRLYIPHETGQRIDLLGLPERFVVAHCSSNEASRDWTQEKWRQLAQDVMSNLDLPVVEIGLKPLLDLESDRYVNLCGQLSLLETAEVIRRARLFIGIDSGPAHLANAVGTFGIILLGEYRNFKRYMPYSGGYANGENANILYHAGPVAEISVNRVCDAIREYVNEMNGDSE